MQSKVFEGKDLGIPVAWRVAAFGYSSAEQLDSGRSPRGGAGGSLGPTLFMVHLEPRVSGSRSFKMFEFDVTIF